MKRCWESGLEWDVGRGRIGVWVRRLRRVLEWSLGCWVWMV